MDKGIRKKIGELLIQEGLITPIQLKEATRVQSQFGGCLCSTLVELGYISTDNALEMLSRQIDIPSINLYETELEPRAIKTLTIKKMKEHKAVPVKISPNGIILAMVNPKDITAINEVEFRSGVAP